MKPVSRLYFFGGLSLATLLVALIGSAMNLPGWPTIVVIGVVVLPLTFGRLTDLGRSWWWAALAFVPLGNFALNAYLATVPGALAAAANSRKAALSASQDTQNFKGGSRMKGWLLGLGFAGAVIVYLLMQIKPVSVQDSNPWTLGADGRIHGPPVLPGHGNARWAEDSKGRVWELPITPEQRKLDALSDANGGLKNSLADAQTQLEGTKQDLEAVKRDLEDLKEKARYSPNELPVITGTPPKRSAAAVQLTQEQFYAAYDAEAVRISAHYPGLLVANSPMHKAYAAQLSIATTNGDLILLDPVRCVDVLAKRATIALGLKLPPADPFDESTGPESASR